MVTNWQAPAIATLEGAFPAGHLRGVSAVLPVTPLESLVCDGIMFLRGRPADAEDPGQRHVPGLGLRQRRQPTPPPPLPRLLGRQRPCERGWPARSGRDRWGGF